MKDYTAAEAIARAWHPVGCRFADLPFETCVFRSQHERTGRLAVKRLTESGWRLVRDVQDDPESIPMFGDVQDARGHQ